MTPVELVLIVGTVARLCRLAQTDTILDRPRRALQRHLGDRKAGELLWCPWCLSVWVGGLVAASWAAWGGHTWWTVVAAALTASQLTGLAAVWEDR